jgi:hypothetical protein
MLGDRDEQLDAVVAIDILGPPVASVRDQRVGSLLDSRLAEAVAGGIEHGLKLEHVVEVGAELAGDDDLLGCADDLAVVVLNAAAGGSHEATGGVADIRPGVRLRSFIARPGTVATRRQSLSGTGVVQQIGSLLERALPLIGPLRQSPLGFGDAGRSAARVDQLSRQLVASASAETVVFGRIGRFRFGPAARHLLVDLGEGTTGFHCSVGRHLGPDQKHCPYADQTGLGAQPQRLNEHPSQAVLVALAERAKVTWSGVRFPARTRKAMSSLQRCSIVREERTPMQ